LNHPLTAALLFIPVYARHRLYQTGWKQSQRPARGEIFFCGKNERFNLLTNWRLILLGIIEVHKEEDIFEI
jgi:hypothetical protein